MLFFLNARMNSYTPLKILVNISFPANSSYRLHSIKLKLDISYIIRPYDEEQCILFQGYSPPNINRVMPILMFL